MSYEYLTHLLSFNLAKEGFKRDQELLYLYAGLFLIRLDIVINCFEIPALYLISQNQKAPTRKHKTKQNKTHTKHGFFYKHQNNLNHHDSTFGIALLHKRDCCQTLSRRMRILHLPFHTRPMLVLGKMGEVLGLQVATI
jgi:hypothetical protein